MSTNEEMSTVTSTSTTLTKPSIQTTTTQSPPYPVKSVDGTDVIEANNKFAIDYYSNVNDAKGNIFFSPWSISSALAMTYEGAKGKTAEEMQSVFHFPKDIGILRNSFRTIQGRMNEGEKNYSLSTANALWAQERYPFLETYLDLVEEYYGGKTTNLDFIGKTEESRVTINKWVEDKTHDKIMDLIPKGLINEYTRLVLTNAIYFKGNWVTSFNENLTEEEDFWINPSTTEKVEMMRLTRPGLIFKYGETKDLKLIELPYAGGELSMLILLPVESDITNLEESLNYHALNEWKNTLRKQETRVYLPKFKFETKYLMKNSLVEMGMPTAFSSVPGIADFSGMTGRRDLAIDEVIHQAFVEVNEEGTEAAAATAVIMFQTTSAGGPEPLYKVFKADHPFIFIIQEPKTGNILFMGRVTNPNQ